MTAIRSLNVTTANRSKIIVPSGFKGYDLCANGYVGCQMGCSYCYVRWFLKDKNYDWGEFVRIREHVTDKLPKELARGHFRANSGTVNNEDARLVIGTMTDPYQPIERKHRITRTMLTAILAAERPLNKVGIFTRSPIVLEDLGLITQLPRKRVHFTVTPLSPELMRLIEPIAIRTDRRFDTVRKLKAAGVRCHVNVAPAIPTISEALTDEYAETLANIGVDEFFVDPMQAYGESWEAMKACLAGHSSWPGIEAVMEDKEAYAEWKEEYRRSWFEAWAKVRKKSPKTLPIWSDHASKTWLDMNTGRQMDVFRYGDDLEQQHS